MSTSEHPMISSIDVKGAACYGPDGQHVGEIDHLMIDKKSGMVAYAVIGFGGFMGLGEDFYPLPWGSMSYDVEKAGYRVNVTKDQLQSAPTPNDDWDRDRAWEQRVHTHFGAPYYW